MSDNKTVIFYVHHMNKLTRKEALKIIESSRYSVIHIDADWDNYRFEVNEKLNGLKAKYIGKVSFAWHRDLHHKCHGCCGFKFSTYADHKQQFTNKF